MNFQDFLTAVVNHTTLSHSPELVEFLKMPDAEFEKMREVVASSNARKPPLLSLSRMLMNL